MKKRFLPFGFVSFIVFGLAGLLVFTAGKVDRDKEVNPVYDGAKRVEGAKEYLNSVRNNQHTGVLDPKDVMGAIESFNTQANFKSTSKEFTWDELGPDNMGGRTRGLIFDNQDASGNTIYAGSVTGGIFKSTNSGSTWNKVNLNSGTACLNVSCMIQDSDGTIYVGTGEGMNSQNYTAYGQFGYEGGFVGKGIFKGTGDDFYVVPGTSPDMNGNIAEWAYINELAIGNGWMYAATNTGLKYAAMSDLTTWNSNIRYKVDSAIISRGVAIDSIAVCDSFKIVNGNFVLYGSDGWETNITSEDTTGVESTFDGYAPFGEQGVCYDVKVNSNGVLYASIGGKLYVSETGNPTKLVSKSIYPDNHEYARKDKITWTSNVMIMNKQNNVLYEGGNTTIEMVDWHTDYKYYEGSDLKGYPSSKDGGRIEFAIAPSDPNIAYAMCSKSTTPNRNGLQGIYLTEDNGQTWRVVAPGGSTLINILGSTYGASNVPYYQGDYNNTLVVFPNNPYRILAGGVDLWYGEKTNETGFFNWSQKSFSQASSVGGIYSPVYCHGDHHVYVFKPTNGKKLFMATDGGIFQASISGSDFSFQPVNKNYITAQFYSLDISVLPNEFIGGTQDQGTVYVGGGNLGRAGWDIWTPANFGAGFPEGTDGGSVAYTTFLSYDVAGEPVNAPVFYSKGPWPQMQGLIDRTRRSETLGYDYALDFLSTDITDSRFITPMAVWESYNDQNSKTEAMWIADKDYAAGATILVRSNSYHYPFNHILEEAVSEDDTLYIKDIITTKLFIGTEDEVYMSLNSVDFSDAPTWFLISDDSHDGVEGVVHCLGYSADGNYLWVGTQDGRIFRISNIVNAYDENTADVSSSNCIVATTEVLLPGEISQVVTSISVDPANADKVLVTLGNYGNQGYIYYCANATADFPEFEAKQGNLPKMPVYAGILEMEPGTDKAVIGTEMGVWATDNIASAEWYFASPEIGSVPVMAVKQRTYYKSKFVITYTDPVTGENTWEIYPEMQNFKDIFVATHGRGVFKYNVDAVGVEENPKNPGASHLEMEVYPNPATSFVKVELNLADRSDVRIDVYDLAGRLVLTSEAKNVPKGYREVDMDISSLREGSYIMQCYAGNSIGISKFIVVK